MFGYRRRRPILGAAVIAGTATMAARSGARRQADAESDRQFQAQQAAELRRLEEERDQARNQRAIDQAVAEALAKQQQQQQQQGEQSRSPVPQRPDLVGNQQYADTPPVYTGADVYASPNVGQPMYLQPPNATGGISPQRRQSPGAVDPDVCFCASCGARANVQFKFCAACGQPMLAAASELQRGPEKQPM